MNIGLIGYGRMGHEIEKAALERGHKVPLIIDINNENELNVGNLKKNKISAVIIFSSPDAGFENVKKCLELDVPVVSGTTGWGEKYDSAVKLCKAKNGSLIHSSNFSIGVNIFFRLNSVLSAFMNKYDDYHVSMEEIHHINKLDAPSGTAITTAGKIIDNSDRYNNWLLCDDDTTNGEINKIPVIAKREGDVPGTHSVLWESTIDSIKVVHEAKNRKGFAVGSILAAEYIYDKKGVFSMEDVMGF